MKLYIKTILSLLSVSILILACDENNTNAKQQQSEQTTDKTKANEEVLILEKQQLESLKTKIDTAYSRNMSGYVEVNGNLEVPPQNQAIVTSTIGANIRTIEIWEGDFIKKGQVLAYLSHPDIINQQTTYLKEYNKGVFLKREFERQKKLYDSGVGSGAVFQQISSEYQSSVSLVKGLEIQLKQISIDPNRVREKGVYDKIPLVSLISGFVESINVKIGQFVSPQISLFEIINPNHIHLKLKVFEKDVSKIKKGQTVRVTVQSISNEKLVAEIYSIGKTFEQNPKALIVHAHIENKTGKLLPGMYVKGKIQVEMQLTKALPEHAIVQDVDKYYAFMVEKEEDKYKMIPVELKKGVIDEGWIAVDFLTPIAPNTLFAHNNAYYFMAEMKKEEASYIPVNLTEE